MLTYFNGFLSYNYNQVIKNHLLDLENSLIYIKSARAQLRACKLRLPSYVKLHFYGLRWAWKVKNWNIHINFSRLIMMKNGNLLYIYGTIHFLYFENITTHWMILKSLLIWINHYMSICLVVTWVSECYIVANFFEFIEEKYNFVKNSHAPESARECFVTIRRSTHDSEDFHSLINHYMYLEVTLSIEYNVLENDRKMTFFQENSILSILSARERARTDMMMSKINSLIIVE